MDADEADAVVGLNETAIGAAKLLRVVAAGAECLDDETRSSLGLLSRSLAGAADGARLVAGGESHGDGPGPMG